MNGRRPAAHETSHASLALVVQMLWRLQHHKCRADHGRAAEQRHHEIRKRWARWPLGARCSRSVGRQGVVHALRRAMEADQLGRAPSRGGMPSWPA